MDARDVIVSPRITEKSMANASASQYTFVVHPHATKTQIRHAVEEIFKVNVLRVNTINVRGKARNFARAASAPKASRATSKRRSSLSSPVKRSNSAASTTSSNKERDAS